jgi:CHASE3 domain sensor protein
MAATTKSFIDHIRGGFSRTTVTSNLPLAVVVVVGAILSFRSHAVLRQDRDMVVHTYQVIGSVRHALLLTEQSQSAQDGFVITGAKESLQRYEGRKKLVPATLSDLDRLLIRNEMQQKRLARLRMLLGQKFGEFDVAIEARRAQGFEAAQAHIKLQQSRAEMDSIRALVSEMESVEERLLEERARHVQDSEKRILLVGAATAAFSVVIRLYLAMRVARKSS